MDKGFSDESITALAACDSPIESKLVAAMFGAPGVQFLMYEAAADSPYKLAISFERNGNVWSLQVQPAPAWLCGRRFDFGLIEARDATICSGVHIETDGRDFHDSAERRAIDIQKDRISLEHGIPVVRFSGSEVFRDSAHCINQAIEIVSRMNDRKARSRGAA